MKPIRVLFVVPPVRLQRQEFEYLIHWPRHAIVLAAELADDYDVNILDITAEFNAEASLPLDHTDLAGKLVEIVQSRVRSFCPDIIAVHAHAAPHIPVVKHVLDALCPFATRSKIVVGGMAASHLTGVVAELVPDGTWIIQGEGTGRCRDIFELVLGHRQSDPMREMVETRQVQGRVQTILPLIGAEKDETRLIDVHVVLIKSDSKEPKEMDYPLPRFDLLPMGVYQKLYESGAFAPHLEMTSGCTYRCTFCGVHYPGTEGRFRMRPVELVIEELVHLRERYGFEEFYFCDETFTLHRPHAHAICRLMIKHLPGIRWRCVTRVDKVDDELAELMHRAGCFEIGFGVESGNNALLEEVDKRATVERNRDTIAMIQRHGIAANALTIIGHPGEDHRHLRQTFEFLARDARPQRCQIFIFHPVPGTEFFAHPERHGLQINVQKIDDWYRFDHIGEAVCDTPYLSREDIARYYMLFNRALPTIVDPDADETLIRRILTNRFPVRRKGVAWLLENGRLRIYRPADPSGSILENTLLIDPSDVTAKDGTDLKRADVVEFVLARCTGNCTREEIASDIEKLFDVPSAVAGEWTEIALGLLMDAAVVSEF